MGSATASTPPCYRSHMNYFKTLSVALLLVVAVPVASANAVVEWELKDDSVSLGMNGVSPHVEKTASGDRVFRSDMVPAGTAVSMCNDAGSCSSETLNVTGSPISDFALATTPSGVRAYFKRIDMASNTQAVYSAACNDANCLSFGAATIASTGMQVSKDTKAWGVPDPVRLPDGRVRIYIVESPSLGTSCPEKVASYISSDGISFTKESGWRLENGYVDTEVLRAKDGDWVMIMADGPGCTSASGARKVQQLYVSTSTDGLSWAKPQLLTSTDVGRLDPTGYEVSPNVFRIYYAAGGSDNNFSIKRATMRIKDTAAGGGVGVTKTTPGKSKSITCVKGKTVRKVSGTTCPKGFKKK